jgi:hypothetical protein
MSLLEMEMLALFLEQPMPHLSRKWKMFTHYRVSRINQGKSTVLVDLRLSCLKEAVRIKGFTKQLKIAKNYE